VSSETSSLASSMPKLTNENFKAKANANNAKAL